MKVEMLSQNFGRVSIAGKTVGAVRRAEGGWRPLVPCCQLYPNAGFEPANSCIIYRTPEAAAERLVTLHSNRREDVR